MILAQDVHDLFGLRVFRESREPAQVAEHDADVAAVTCQDFLVAAGRQNEFGDLRRQKPFQAADAFDFRDLVGDALLERLVPGGEVGRLRGDRVVQFLDAQHRFHARDQRGLIDRLGQIFVGAGIEALDHVLAVRLGGHQDDRHERHAGIRLDAAGHFDAVDLRHHHVEQNKVWQMLLGGGERLLAVAGLQQFVAVDFQPRDQNITVGFVVVDDQYARRLVHDESVSISISDIR